MSQQQEYRIFIGAFPQGEIASRLQAVREHYDRVTARITAPHVTLAGTYWRRGPATAEQEAETMARLQTIGGERWPWFVLQTGSNVVHSLGNVCENENHGRCKRKFKVILTSFQHETFYSSK